MRDWNSVRLPKPFTLAVACAVLVLTAVGCGRSAPWPPTPGSAPQSPTDASDNGYREPPQVRRAVRGPGGSVVLLSGQALPGAIVRLASPSGQHQEVQADASGVWSLTAPPGGPALYGVSQEADGRRDQAQGYLAILPTGEPAAAVLRSGDGAVVLAPSNGKLMIMAVDFDGTGAAVVSGRAGANEPLKVLVDGTAAVDGAAGADGRFFLSLPKPLAPGLRVLQVRGPSGGGEVSVDIGPTPPFAVVLRASRREAGWRLDWTTPTGGVQTTELFALQEPAH